MTGSPRSAEAQAARIDTHWDFNDPAQSEAAFRALLADVGSSDDPDFTAQVQTQIARAYELPSTDPWLAEREPLRLERLAALGGVQE